MFIVTSPEMEDFSWSNVESLSPAITINWVSLRLQHRPNEQPCLAHLASAPHVHPCPETSIA